MNENTYALCFLSFVEQQEAFLFRNFDKLRICNNTLIIYGVKMLLADMWNLSIGLRITKRWTEADIIPRMHSQL